VGIGGSYRARRCHVNAPPPFCLRCTLRNNSLRIRMTRCSSLPPLPKQSSTVAMRRILSSRRSDAPKLEARRLSALPHIQAGDSLSVIARRLGVSRQAVYQWAQNYRQRGPAGLRRRGRSGRRPKLPRHQLAQLPRLLARGAQAHGLTSNEWTSQRVAEIIWRCFGVRYGRAYVCHLLHRFRWSWQRPAARVPSKAVHPRWVQLNSAHLKRTPRI
jgi:transposase